VRGRLDAAVGEAWARGLIRSWNAADWIGAPARIGAKIAPLVGAAADEVIVADSTSVNLYKLLAAALGRQRASGRSVIVTEPGNFPTDLYVAQGLTGLVDGASLRVRPAAELAAALDEDVAVVMLTHVHYKTGTRHDLARITAQAHAAGALALWDLSHSAGAVAVDLAGAGADLAVGCGYKYLNGGPGAPAWLYVARRLQGELSSPLTGWMGHDAPFDFDDDYRPAPGLGRFLAGTPPILGMTALEAGVDLFADIAMADVEAKGQRLANLFVAQVEDRCAGHGLALATPREPARRGSHVSFAHPHAWPIMQALIARGVIGDFRAPDILRFGFTPLYLGYEDVWRAVEALREVLASGAWRAPQFQARLRVT
jgi:kynureninase